MGTGTTIGELVDLRLADLQTGPFGTQLKASEYTHAGIPVINVRNIGFGEIRDAKLEYVDTRTGDRLHQHRLAAQDIVFGRKGAVERHAFLRDEHDGWIQGSDCIRLRFNGGPLLPRYVSYCLLTSTHQQWMANHCSHAATMASLNQDIIRRIEIPTPPLDVQRKIAAVLSAYDELIENNLRRIEILEEMAQAVYREWFVNFRFPGHEDVALVDSPLGPIPEGWEARTIGDSSVAVMGQSPKSEFYNDKELGLPFHQGVTNFGVHFPNHVTFCTVESRVAEAGDALVSVRAPVGRINVANTRLVIGRGLAALRATDGYPGFHYRQVREIFREEDSMGGGTIYKAITKGDLLGIPWLAPGRSISALFDEFETSYIRSHCQPDSAEHEPAGYARLRPSQARVGGD